MNAAFLRQDGIGADQLTVGFGGDEPLGSSAVHVSGHVQGPNTTAVATRLPVRQDDLYHVLHNSQIIESFPITQIAPSPDGNLLCPGRQHSHDPAFAYLGL
jgi:hypothetical protein